MDVLYKWQTTKRRRFPDFVGGSSEHLAFEWDGQEVVLGFETIERVHNALFVCWTRETKGANP